MQCILKLADNSKIIAYLRIARLPVLSWKSIHGNKSLTVQPRALSQLQNQCLCCSALSGANGDFLCSAFLKD